MILRRYLALWVLFLTGASSTAAQTTVDFQRDVRPILADNCFQCHGPDEGSRWAGLRLDIQDSAFGERPDGWAIVPVEPGDLVKGRIYHVVVSPVETPGPDHYVNPRATGPLNERWINGAANNRPRGVLFSPDDASTWIENVKIKTLLRAMRAGVREGQPARAEQAAEEAAWIVDGRCVRAVRGQINSVDRLAAPCAGPHSLPNQRPDIRSAEVRESRRISLHDHKVLAVVLVEDLHAPSATRQLAECRRDALALRD